MTPIRIDVATGESRYSVLIGPGVSRTLRTLLEEAGVGSGRLVVSNARVWRLHGQRLRGIGSRPKPTLIGDGERAKTLATVAGLYRACVRERLDRSSAIVALGGGVVGDVAGFAAATYLRGLTLVQVPTTLLAQVDSSIGGKVGVNLPAGKNLVGSFHAPRLVVCDPDVLDTLTRREFQAGLYEVLKYGIIASRPLFERVAATLPAIVHRETTALTPLIADCCRIKVTVVSADERESGLRRTLNFGHTVGHALEAITGYRRLRHGEAIGYGMLAAIHLSVARGLVSRADAAFMSETIHRLGPLPSVTDLSMRHVLDAVTRDKKVLNGRLHFVLARGIGDTQITTDIRPTELTAALRAIGLKR
jgi:3-dehydroquinate synthase